MKVISGQSPYSGYMSWDKEVTGDLVGGKREGENPIPRRSPRAQSIPMRRFLQALFGDRNMAARAAETGRAILVARSLRRTEGGRPRRRTSESSGFCAGWTPASLEEAEAPPRWNDPRLGRPNMWEDAGFWLLLLATPIGGGLSLAGWCAIPPRR